MSFSTTFLDALGRWQRGWGQNPARRGPIARDLLEEALKLPDRYRVHDGAPVYRKRHLYRREDQRELKPLFLKGVLNEGSITSWTTDLEFAKYFDEVLDQNDVCAVAGGIFRHIPAPEEIVLSIPALWSDCEFVTAAEAYRDRGGAEGGALFHFRGRHEQSEIILSAPLRVSELHLLSGVGSFDGIADQLGALSEDERDAVQMLISASGEDIYKPRWLNAEATARVKDNVIRIQKQNTLIWMARRFPSQPTGRRARLSDALILAKEEGATPDQFMGWRRLPTPGGVLEARWRNGVIAYHDSRGRVWLW